ncbi:hypothetical protein [Citromicrobium bathyomarinum]|uniref:hypothetical protein n=1 Tax=Citromicrobium bathyomarinum TaxID=72174 RepID=UPI001E5FFECA|nr:hypothetical protein [Citromicrobium bathyomarinum]MCD1621827.1 hypothetical protein [Citromicrobium bathyomarinum]
MSDAKTLAADPHWLPHRIDPVAGTMEFLRVERAALADTGFLADRTGQARALPLAEVQGLSPETGPLHFIFHTAFCRSTLLVRALDIPGVSAGLSEPGIIASLVNAGQAGEPLIAPVTQLLARPWGEGEAVFVKPTNHANRLVPALMNAAPQARAILMTNPLPSFLAAVIRKGMMGRRWGRQLYLEMMGYAPLDLGMDGREQFLMTDLQAAGLAWFLNQRYLDAIARQYGDRVRVLDGDRFDGARAETLAAIGSFTGVAIDPARAEEIAQGPVFARDAKTGADFTEKSIRDREATHSAVVEDEIAKVGEWVGMIAQQVGLTVPVKQTLF